MERLDSFKVCLMNHAHDYLDVDGTSEETNGCYWAEKGDPLKPYIDYTAGVVATTENATFFGANF